jgi:glucose-1-phosphate adenylyltransferase
MLDKTLAIVLAGGSGSRLKPLTQDRAKPAVPFGGKYRIVDFTLTNCLHSGLRRVLVLTQYKSHSLQKHLRDGWSIFNPELGEYITPVPPQMRAGESWYTGTANAIHQNRYLLERSGAERVLILYGDHIYRMDYAPLIRAHTRHGAAATLACMAAPLEETTRFGVAQVDPKDRIMGFAEKPGYPAPLDGDPAHALASMGVYVFSMAVLLDWLERDHADGASGHDFGHDILPRLIDAHPVYAYRFGGNEGRVSVDRYWRDVGTLDGFYDANMDLLEPVSPLDLYQEDWPIRTYSGQHPPARTVPGTSGTEGICINSIVASGAVIAGGSTQRSILSAGVYLDDESLVEESILFEGVRVGEGAHLRRCIVDKHVTIPPGARVGHEPDSDRERFTVTENGIVVMPKGYRFTHV